MYVFVVWCGSGYVIGESDDYFGAIFLGGVGERETWTSDPTTAESFNMRDDALEFCQSRRWTVEETPRWISDAVRTLNYEYEYRIRRKWEEVKPSRTKAPPATRILEL